MSSYLEGQTHQLMEALEAKGFTPEEITKLGQSGELLARFRSVLNGLAKIKPVSEDAARVITLNEITIAVNLAATPKLSFSGAEVEVHIGEGWAIVEKRADGLYVNGRKVILYLSKRQMKGKQFTGHELREELTGKPVLNANLLDAIADNPHLIPEDWKKDDNGNTRYIFFWATIYRNSNGVLSVRYLCFNGSDTTTRCYWLVGDWFVDYPAVLLASS